MWLLLIDAYPSELNMDLLWGEYSRFRCVYTTAIIHCGIICNGREGGIFSLLIRILHKIGNGIDSFIVIVNCVRVYEYHIQTNILVTFALTLQNRRNY